MSASTFDVVDFFSKAGVGVITGAVAAIVTAKVALNRFYYEKWWERKSSAYNQLIDNLFELQILHREVIINLRLERMIGEVEPLNEGVMERWTELEISIKRALVFSPITLSEKTTDHIKKYLDQTVTRNARLYRHKGETDKVYTRDAEVLNDVIDKVVKDAKEELKYK